MVYVTCSGVVVSAHRSLKTASKARRKHQRKQPQHSYSIWRIDSPGGWRGPDGNSRQWQPGDTPVYDYWQEQLVDVFE